MPWFYLSDGGCSSIRSPSKIALVPLLVTVFSGCEASQQNMAIEHGSVPQAAKAYLSWTLEGSVGLRLGSGRGAQGPLGHLPSLLDPKPAHEGRRGGALWDPQRYLRLYAVTDSRMNARWGRSLSDAVRLAAQGGATIIQIR